MGNGAKIFVGSSSEAEDLDREIRAALEDVGAVPRSWREAFRPGDFGLETLLRVAHEVDGALLLATPDDRTWYRGDERYEPRDNIMFELGIFLSILGRRRTAIVDVKINGRRPDLPSDLAGITTMRIDLFKRATAEREIGKWLARLHKRSPRSKGSVLIVYRLLRQLAEVPYDWHQGIDEYIFQPLQVRLTSAVRGELPLTPGQYYQALYAEMDGAQPGTMIFAVSTISSVLWMRDQDQKKYARKNHDASRRGVKIRRLFVAPYDEDVDFPAIVSEQQRAGIAVRFAQPDLLAENHMLEDVVLFYPGQETRPRGYVAMPSFDNQHRIRGGKILLDPMACDQQRRAFERAWSTASSPDSLGGKVGLQISLAKPEPPGKRMKARRLAKPVVSCLEAAAARSVPLRNELKTLILSTADGFVATHVPGNKRVSVKAVREALETPQVSLALPSELENLGLSRGTVCPVLEPVWSLPHLISRSILTLDFVTTNNGTLTSYFTFDPVLLLQAELTNVGDYEEPDELLLLIGETPSRLTE